MPRITTDETGVENVVQVSRNYNKFDLMINNREVVRGHVEALKKAFQEIGNLTRVQPILVNERFQIIDGQHRFIVAKELEEPVYFMVQRGLGIKDARQMNILHRGWTLDDYAKSYALTDPNYKQYLEVREDYGFGHSTTLLYIVGEETKGMFSDFRNGEFVMIDLPAARARLDKLANVQSHVRYGRNRYFAYAYLKVIAVPGFNEDRMLRKLDEVGDSLLRQFGNTTDFLRVLEEIYNYRMSERNRLRLY